MHYYLYLQQQLKLQDFITLETGQNVTLDCEMYGYLRGKIEWLKNGQQVQSGGRYSITVRTGSREGQVMLGILVLDFVFQYVHLEHLQLQEVE